MVSIIIPVFNEEKNIFNLVIEIFEILKNHFVYEVIIVNDYSNDKTDLYLKKLKKNLIFQLLIMTSNMVKVNQYKLVYY